MNRLKAFSFTTGSIRTLSNIFHHRKSESMSGSIISQPQETFDQGLPDETRKCEDTSFDSSMVRMFGVPEFFEFHSRPIVELEIYDKLSTAEFLVIYGPAGSGKTSQMAQLVANKKIQAFGAEGLGNVNVVIWINCHKWSLSFDQDEFLQELTEVVNNLQPESCRHVFRELNELSHLFADRRILLVLDNVLNVEIVGYISTNRSPALSCCFTTKEKMFIDLADFCEIPRLSNEEVAKLLSTNSSIKINGEVLVKLVDLSMGLPLLANLISSCLNSLDPNNFDELLSEINSCQETSLGNSSQVIASCLFQHLMTALEQSGDHINLRRMYYAFLLFSPDGPIEIKDIGAMWGFDNDLDRTVEVCNMFKKQRLLRWVGSKLHEPRVIIHEMQFEAAFDDAMKQDPLLANLDKTTQREECLDILRQQILNGYCNFRQSSLEGSQLGFQTGRIQHVPGSSHQQLHLATTFLCSALESQNSAILYRFIEEVDSEYLPKICHMKVASKSNELKSFALHLFNFVWKDDVVHLSGDRMIRLSHQVLIRIYLTAHRNSLEISQIVDEKATFADHVFSHFQQWEKNSTYKQLCRLVDPQRYISMTYEEKDIYDDNCRAALVGDVETLRSGLQAENDVETDHVHLMEIGAKFGQMEVVQFLCEKYRQQVGVQFDRIHDPLGVKLGQNALTWAAWYGYSVIVMYLCEQFPGAESSEDDLGRTAAILAAANGHLAIAKFLHEKSPGSLELSDNERQTALDLVVKRGHLEVVSFLASNYPEFVDTEDSAGRTPLSLAAEYGHPRIVKSLHKLFPEAIELVDKKYRNPLSYAAQYGHYRVVKYLCKCFPKGAMISDRNERTPLSYAASHGHVDTVRFLYRSYRRAVRILDSKYQRTVLSLVAASGHSEIVEFLYEKYPKAAEMRDLNGRTALSLAAEKGHLDVVKFLYQKFPNAVEFKDYAHGLTALGLAAGNGHTETVTFLFEVFPRASYMKDFYGRTPLDLALANGHFNAAKALGSDELPNDTNSSKNVQLQSNLFDL